MGMHSTFERYCSTLYYLMFYIIVCTAVHCTFKIEHFKSIVYIILCTAVHCTFNIIHTKSAAVHCYVYCLHKSM